jgi:Ran GTPase-activating protein (RanGAP) involved in mRNA processing and transport
MALRPSSPSSPVRRYIPADAEELNLRGKNIDANKGKQIAMELASNTMLTSLVLSDIKIGDGGAVSLAHALVTNKSLSRLHLPENGIGDIGITALAQALTQNDSLESLDVGWNQFGIVGLTSLSNALKGFTSNSIDVEEAVVLADARKANTSLTKLNLWRNSVGNEGAALLGEALRVNTSLTYLFLGDNIIRNEGAVLLLKALVEFNTTLTDLYLHGNRHISEAMLPTINAFVDANKAGIRLLHARGKLDLSSKGIDDAKAKIIATDLSRNTTVTTLVLNGNEIGFEGGVDIASALITNRILSSIELDGNSIGDAGCLAMAEMLLQNGMLSKILLNGNSIGLAGVGALAKSLLTNTRLQHLGLGWNDFGNEGAAAMLDVLKHNETLERLDVSDNNVIGEGAMAFLATLEQSNLTLTSLNLDNNAKISPVLLKAIDFILASRLVLNSFRNCLHRSVEKRLLSLAIHAVQQSSFYHEGLERAHCQETRAGPIFLLLRTAALNDSKAITVTAPSRKRWRML